MIQTFTEPEKEIPEDDIRQFGLEIKVNAIDLFIGAGYKVHKVRVGDSIIPFLVLKDKIGRTIEKTPIVYAEGVVYITGIYVERSGKHRGRRNQITIRVPFRIAYADTKDVELKEKVKALIEDESVSIYRKWVVENAKKNYKNTFNLRDYDRIFVKDIKEMKKETLSE
jgi:hypothetical protein